MNACELTASITAIANYLACQLTTEELELLGVSLTQLGRRSACQKTRFLTSWQRSRKTSRQATRSRRCTQVLQGASCAVSQKALRSKTF